jgi:hypothetical protein
MIGEPNQYLNTWIEVAGRLKKDDNPDGENECPGGEKDEKIVWGGPVVIFRSDQIKDFYIRCASIREIIPPKLY